MKLSGPEAFPTHQTRIRRVPSSSPSLTTRDSKPDPQTMFDVRASPKLSSRLDSKERLSVKEVAVNADELSGTGGDSAGRRRRRRTGSDNDGSSEPAFFSKPELDGVAILDNTACCNLKRSTVLITWGLKCQFSFSLFVTCGTD